MFLELDPVLYIWGYLFIVYVTLLRLIVLFSRCRVNRGTNLPVVLYCVIFLLLPLRVWASMLGVPNLWGRSPLWLCSLRNIWFRSLEAPLPSEHPPPPPLPPSDFASFVDL